MWRRWNASDAAPPGRDQSCSGGEPAHRAGHVFASLHERVGRGHQERVDSREAGRGARLRAGAAIVAVVRSCPVLPFWRAIAITCRAARRPLASAACTVPDVVRVGGLAREEQRLAERPRQRFGGGLAPDAA